MNDPSSASASVKLSPKRLQGLSLLQANHKQYDYTPDTAKLETFENAFPKRHYVITFDCPEYTSLCPVTGQPDFGHIVIDYIPRKRCVESKSLKLHLYSYRNHNTFHEESVNLILEALVEACDPRWACVTGTFRPRGGIAIHVKAVHGKRPADS